MAANDNLSPGQFPRLFHGSVNDLKGDYLKPGVYGGASGAQDEWRHLGQSRNDYVSATHDESTAWNFSSMASAQHLHNRGRARVYEVEPNADTKIGVEHVDHPVRKQAFAENRWKKPADSGEHISPQFKVIAQHDTRPGSQGTFPTVDWTKHAAPGKQNMAVNHPFGPRPQYDEHYKQAHSEQLKRRKVERENPSANGSQKEVLF